MMWDAGWAAQREWWYAGKSREEKQQSAVGASPDSAEQRPGRVRELYPYALFHTHIISRTWYCVRVCVCVRCDTIGLRLCWIFDAGFHFVAVHFRFKQACSEQAWPGVQRSFQALLPCGPWSSHCPWSVRDHWTHMIRSVKDAWQHWTYQCHYLLQPSEQCISGETDYGCVKMARWQGVTSVNIYTSKCTNPAHLIVGRAAFYEGFAWTGVCEDGCGIE